MASALAYIHSTWKPPARRGLAALCVHAAHGATVGEKIENKSDCLKTWLFRKDRVVRFWEDLHIFKLKPVSGHLKPQKISAPNNKKKRTLKQSIKQYTTFKYHLPIPLKNNQKKTKYRYDTGKSSTLGSIVWSPTQHQQHAGTSNS